jgi:8-oxo-dGTP pyrophosphatase MutT (NUDIX family)
VSTTHDSERERVSRSVRPLNDVPTAPGWNHEELEGLIDAGPRRAASVLVALVEREAGLSMLFTRRNDSLSQHAGQVSFPGGGVDVGDADAIAAALRETHEEIGIDAALIHPFGYLDAFETISNYCVTPVVAWLDASYTITVNPSEVAEVFEVPLAFFLDPSNRHALRMNFRGRVRELYEYQYAGQRIWGATAAMLLNLVRRMGSEHAVGGD